MARQVTCRAAPRGRWLALATLERFPGAPRSVDLAPVDAELGAELVADPLVLRRPEADALEPAADLIGFGRREIPALFGEWGRGSGFRSQLLVRSQGQL